MNGMLNISAIKTALEREGLSSASLAKNLGVSREAVSKWLNGENFPRPDKLLKLALLVKLSFDDIVIKQIDEREPLIAFRKKGAARITEKHINHAKELGWLLRPLAHYLPFDEFVRPATLKHPTCDYDYVQKIASKIREEIGVRPMEPLDFRHLIKKFAELQAVLIPVLWGTKERHENALHIYLPDSMTTWIYLNLDTEVHDFKFWMAHEIGHILSPSLVNDEAEDFADAFAGALLFPKQLAEQAYQQISRNSNNGYQINKIIGIAEENTISPITVYLELNRFAENNSEKPLNLEPGIYGAAKNLSQSYYIVSDALFDAQKPEPAKYIDVVETQFDSPFYKALKTYLVEKCKGPGYVQSILDIPMLDAKAIHSYLA